MPDNLTGMNDTEAVNGSGLPYDRDRKSNQK